MSLSLMELVKIHVLASFFFSALGTDFPYVGASAAFLGAIVVGRLFLLAWSAVYWLRGAWIEAQLPDHSRCVVRFDEGLRIFLFVFSATALVGADDLLPARLVLPFFALALLALGASRTGGAGLGGMPRRRGLAALVPVAASLLLASLGLSALAPALVDSAARSGRGLKNAVSAFELQLGRFLDWLFVFRPAAGPSPAKVNLAPPSEPGLAEGGPALTILLWTLGIAALLFILGLVLILLSRLFRLIVSLLEARGPGPGLSFLPARFRILLLACARFLSRIEALLPWSRPRRSAAIACYARLLACGRLGGLPRRSTETVGEYAGRLGSVFPRGATKAQFVVGALEREIYGAEVLDGKTEGRLAALRRGMIPGLWLLERITKALGRRGGRGGG